MFEKINRQFFKLKSKASFSQCGEDLIIKYILRSGGIKYPTYVDVGAYDPVKLSNTFLFYLYGSRGINIEPNPERYERFLKTRKRDVNVNIGIAESDGTLDYFYFQDSSLNSFSESEKNQYALNFELTKAEKYRYLKSEKIQVKSLMTVLQENNFIHFDFLSIDTEGMDFNILKSLNFMTIRPKVVCFESVEHSVTGQGKRRLDLLDLLKSNGYYEYAFTGLNSIMVDSNFFKNV